MELEYKDWKDMLVSKTAVSSEDEYYVSYCSSCWSGTESSSDETAVLLTNIIFPTLVPSPLPSLKIKMQLAHTQYCHIRYASSVSRV